jgi:hypothetical protein
MYKNVLLVFSKQETALRSEIEEQALSNLTDLAGEIVVVHAGKDRSDALNRDAQLEMQFAIIGHALAGDGRSPIEDDGGLTLSAQLRKRGRTYPILLLIPQVTVVTNSMIERCAELNVTPYRTEPDVFAIIRRQVRTYQPPAKILDVVLRLRSDASWEYELIGTRFAYYHNGPLNLDSPSLAMARALSQAIGTTPGEEWYGLFESLGRSLMQRLCTDTKFGIELPEGIKLAGGVEHARISLSLGSVDRTHYPIALEALFPPSQYPEIPWMVRAPFYRNVAAGRPIKTSLFGPSQGPLNVLLITADAHGFVDKVTGADGKSLQLRPLANAERECDALQRYLHRRAAERPIAELRPLKVAAPGKLSRLRLLDTLEERDWDVVHFAGHSFAREDGEKESRGYLFVGGPGEPEAIEIEVVAPLLKRATMVYLSSCDSSSPAFAIELARHGVPIVIGFRWKVDDRFAAHHALLFYHFLFRERNVETAFLRTRRAIHRRFSTKDRVWASSMLLFGR